MCKFFGLVLGLALLAGCSEPGLREGHAPGLQASVAFPLECPRGAVMRAKDSGGRFKFLRSPVEQDGLEVLRLLQTLGPSPRDHMAMLYGVDKGTVRPYHGPGYVLWYFQAHAGVPAKLPWVDHEGACMGSTPVLSSEEHPGWVYAKVPHWARVNVPTEVLTRGDVCAKAYHFETVHDVKQTAGSFSGMPGVICVHPGHTQEVLRAGYDGVLLIFVTPSEAPPIFNTIIGSPQ